MSSFRIKKYTQITVIMLILLCSLIAAIVSYAEQENNFDVPCEHQYSLINFQGGIAAIECCECEDTYQIHFTDYINEKFELLDVVDDGVINAKDYAQLIKEYNNQN